MADLSKDNHTQTRLKGSLGTGSIVFMVIAAAAPLTVVGGNAPIIFASGNGAGAPVGFVIASIVMLMFAVGFVTMTPHVKEAGAFFSYVTLGLGQRMGLGTAFLALVTYTAIQAGIYGYMGWAVNDFVHHVLGGPLIPWWVYTFASIALVAFLGYRHIDLSSRFLGIALVLEIAVVMVTDLAVLWHGGAHGINADSFTPHEALLNGGLGVAILFAMTGFIGFEATAVFRDEARHPEVTIPKATYLAVIIIGVFYTFSTWALVIGNGVNQVGSVAQQTLDGNANLIMDTAQVYAGSVVRDSMQVLLLTSLFACVLSFHNVLTRYKLNLSKQGSLPVKLSHIHHHHHSPSFASLVQTITAVVIMCACVLFKLNPLVQVFGYMAGISTLGIVLLMLLTTLAVLRFFKQNPALVKGKQWHTRIAPNMAGIMLLTCLWLVLDRFTMVTGGSIEISIALAAVPFIAFIIGALRGKPSCPTVAIPQKHTV
ncbi:putative amino acid permease YhdG [Halomonadaceae bacterium LMG 33818]|uniref:APC family permease n=1 Tax=Cernens ardua TaxID=3402176 RepID=UPI003EDC89B4